MQQSLFKHFTRSEHADHFLEGRLLFRTLQYFVDYEDGQVRGDQNEGTHVYRPDQGLRLEKVDGRKLPMLGSEFQSSVAKGHIYVFCMSTSRSEKLAAEFASLACVEVQNKRQFLERVRAALEAKGKMVFAGQLSYRSRSEPPAHRWALPEVICMTKSPNFKRQFEYRIAFAEPEVFAPENVEVRIVPQGHREGAMPAHIESLTIDVGRIRDICLVHDKA